MLRHTKGDGRSRRSLTHACKAIHDCEAVQRQLNTLTLHLPEGVVEVDEEDGCSSGSSSNSSSRRVSVAEQLASVPRGAALRTLVLSCWVDPATWLEDGDGYLEAPEAALLRPLQLGLLTYALQHAHGGPFQLQGITELRIVQVRRPSSFCCCAHDAIEGDFDKAIKDSTAGIIAAAAVADLACTTIHTHRPDAHHPQT